MRFNSYTEYNKTKLKNITEKVVRKAELSSTAPIRMISYGNGFILQSEKYSRENAGESLKNYTLLFKGEMAYNHGASKNKPYGVCYELKESESARVPFVYHTFKIIKGDSKYWNYALNLSAIDRQLKKLVSSGARMDGLLNISYDEYMSINIFEPCIEEQHKIAIFLSKIDERIETQSKIIKAIESQIFVISHIMICNSTETIKFKNLCTLENKTARKSGDGIKDGIYPFFTNEENQTQYLNDYDFDGEYIIANTGGRANFKYYNGKFAVMSDSLVIKIKNTKYTTFYNNVLRDKQAYINHVGFEGSGLKHLNKDWLLNLQVPVFNENTKKYLFVVEELKNKLIKEKDILSLYKKQKAYLLQNMFI